jgi:hypothetical protein
VKKSRRSLKRRDRRENATRKQARIMGSEMLIIIIIPYLPVLTRLGMIRSRRNLRLLHANKGTKLADNKDSL